MKTFILPDGSFFDDEEMLRNKEGVLLPDGIYKDGENILLYEGIFNSSMSWGDEQPKKIEEPILDIDDLEMLENCTED